MAKIEEFRNLLKKELAPINTKLEQLTTNFEELKSSVKFLSDKYDEVLNQLQSTHLKLQHQGGTLKFLKEELSDTKKSAGEAMQQIEELAQYIRRDCLELEMTGTKTTAILSSDAISK